MLIKYICLCNSATLVLCHYLSLAELSWKVEATGPDDAIHKDRAWIRVESESVMASGEYIAHHIF